MHLEVRRGDDGSFSASIEMREHHTLSRLEPYRLISTHSTPQVQHLGVYVIIITTTLDLSLGQDLIDRDTVRRSEFNVTCSDVLQIALLVSVQLSVGTAREQHSRWLLTKIQEWG